MYQTFELYLRETTESEPRFEPLSCVSAVEVMHKARELLARDEGLASVEVRMAGQHLFTLER